MQREKKVRTEHFFAKDTEDETKKEKSRDQFNTSKEEREREEKVGFVMLWIDSFILLCGLMTLLKKWMK
jgi:hypothetical protein